ncbi:MAG: hypothetical protein H6730_06945 [Deltaproteobacteria bacterium]|nr:hypothetical protein [Deltaproteobacteria bacterium]
MRRVLAPLALALALAACGGEPADPCESGPTFTNTVKEISDAKCLSCHSKDAEGANRAGAPVGMDFDDYASIQPILSDFADALTSGRMPPMGAPGISGTTPAERTLVNDWRVCGYPQ